MVKNIDTKEEVERKMKWLPIYLWVLGMILGLALSVKILLKLAGIN